MSLTDFALPMDRTYATLSWPLVFYMAAFTSGRGGLYKTSERLDTVKSYRCLESYAGTLPAPPTGDQSSGQADLHPRAGHGEAGFIADMGSSTEPLNSRSCCEPILRRRTAEKRDCQAGKKKN